MTPITDVANLLGALHDVRATLLDIQQLLDPRQWLAGVLQASQLGQFLDALRGYLLSTADISDGRPRPFTRAGAITHYEPFTRAIADAGLVAVATWASFRLMWAQTARNHYALHLLLPRILLAILLINFSLPLIQAAIEINNVLCGAVLGGLGESAFSGLVKEVFVDGAKDLGSGPGLTVLTTAALLLGFLLLALAYVIRYALLVLLAVTAPLAALCFVLPETHRYAREWGGLFVTSLFMQPMQLLILAVAFALERDGGWPVRHVFALAALWLVFKVPGALHSAGGVGTHAFSTAKLSAGHLGKALAKGVA